MISQRQLDNGRDNLAPIWWQGQLPSAELLWRVYCGNGTFEGYVLGIRGRRLVTRLIKSPRFLTFLRPFRLRYQQRRSTTHMSTRCNAGLRCMPEEAFKVNYPSRYLSVCSIDLNVDCIASQSMTIGYSHGSALWQSSESYLIEPRYPQLLLKASSLSNRQRRARIDVRI